MNTPSISAHCAASPSVADAAVGAPQAARDPSNNLDARIAPGSNYGMRSSGLQLVWDEHRKRHVPRVIDAAAVPKLYAKLVRQRQRNGEAVAPEPFPEINGNLSHRFGRVPSNFAYTANCSEDFASFGRTDVIGKATGAVGMTVGALTGGVAVAAATTLTQSRAQVWTWTHDHKKWETKMKAVRRDVIREPFSIAGSRALASRAQSRFQTKYNLGFTETLAVLEVQDRLLRKVADNFVAFPLEAGQSVLSFDDFRTRFLAAQNEYIGADERARQEENAGEPADNVGGYLTTSVQTVAAAGATQAMVMLAAPTTPIQVGVAATVGAIVVAKKGSEAFDNISYTEQRKATRAMRHVRREVQRHSFNETPSFVFYHAWQMGENIREAALNPNVAREYIDTYKAMTDSILDHLEERNQDNAQVERATTGEDVHGND